MSSFLNGKLLIAEVVDWLIDSLENSNKKTSRAFIYILILAKQKGI